MYKEDFEKFAEGLTDVVEYIKSNQEVVEKRYEPNFEDPAYASESSKDDFSF
ncbi:hypothetical protein D3C87_1708080 [compost metagenome]